MTDTDATSGSRCARLGKLSRVGAVGLVLMLLLALIITLNPSPVDAGHRETVSKVLRALHGIGVPETFQYVQLEFTANVVMFVPLGFFFALFVAGRWGIAFAFPPVLSFAIEVTQYALLPARFADVSDLIANSVGGWIGVGLAAIIAGMRRATCARVKADVRKPNTRP